MRKILVSEVITGDIISWYHPENKEQVKATVLGTNHLGMLRELELCIDGIDVKWIFGASNEIELLFR